MDNKFLRSTLISVEWLQKIILPYWPSPSKYVKKSPNEIGHFDKTWSYFLKALSLLRSHAYCFFEVHSGLDFQNKVHYPKENSICRSCYFFSMLRPLCIWNCDVCCIFKTPLFIGVYNIAFYFIDNNYKLRKAWNSNYNYKSLWPWWKNGTFYILWKWQCITLDLQKFSTCTIQPLLVADFDPGEKKIAHVFWESPNF